MPSCNIKQEENVPSMISQLTAASIYHNKISPQVLFILSSETSKNKRPLQTCHRGFCFILCDINQMSQIFTFLSPLGTQTWTWRRMIESTCSVPIEAPRQAVAGSGTQLTMCCSCLSALLCFAAAAPLLCPHMINIFSNLRSFTQRVFQLSTSFDFPQCQFTN